MSANGAQDDPARLAAGMAGGWRLRHWREIRNGIAREVPATGLLIYALEDGAPAVMTALFHRASDPPSAAISYGGRWSVGEGVVYHHVQISSLENFVGQHLTRTLSLSDGGVLSLATLPETAAGGDVFIHELVWARS